MIGKPAVATEPGKSMGHDLGDSHATVTLSNHILHIYIYTHTLSPLEYIYIHILSFQGGGRGGSWNEVNNYLFGLRIDTGHPSLLGETCHPQPLGPGSVQGAYTEHAGASR